MLCAYASFAGKFDDACPSAGAESRNGFTAPSGAIASAELTIANMGVRTVDGATVRPHIGRAPRQNDLRDTGIGRSATSRPGSGTSSRSHRSMRALISNAGGSKRLNAVAFSLAQRKVSGDASALTCDNREPGTIFVSGGTCVNTDRSSSRNGLDAGAKQSGAPSNTRPRTLCSIAQKIAASVPPSECPTKNGAVLRFVCDSNIQRLRPYICSPIRLDIV
jgi:hypothetical protein